MKIRAVTGNITDIKAGAIILGFFQATRHMDEIIRSVDKVLNQSIAGLIKQGDIKGKAGEFTLLCSYGKIPSDRIMIAGMGKKKDLTISKISDTIAEACRQLRQKGVTNVATVPLGAGINRIRVTSAAAAVTEGAIMGLYRFRRYMKKTENDSEEVKELQIVVGEKDRIQVERAIEKGRIIADSVNWARDLVNEPANNMTPEIMAEVARKLAKNYGLSIEVMEEKQISQAGMGGLLGVFRGSHQPPRFIVLGYKGSNSNGVDIADIKNIGNRYGGAITAAKFLEDFVDGTPWVHLDIAGTSDTEKEKGYLVKGATGIPVRTLVNFILAKL